MFLPCLQWDDKPLPVCQGEGFSWVVSRATKEPLGLDFRHVGIFLPREGAPERLADVTQLSPLSFQPLTPGSPAEFGPGGPFLLLLEMVAGPSAFHWGRRKDEGLCPSL